MWEVLTSQKIWNFQECGHSAVGVYTYSCEVSNNRLILHNVYKMSRQCIIIDTTLCKCNFSRRCVESAIHHNFEPFLLDQQRLDWYNQVLQANCLTHIFIRLDLGLGRLFHSSSQKNAHILSFVTEHLRIYCGQQVEMLTYSFQWWLDFQSRIILGRLKLTHRLMKRGRWSLSVCDD